jgi:sugar phosphate permease
MRVNAHTDCDTMAAKPEVDEIRLSSVLFLLALSVFINYLDRGNLRIAAPLLKNEFQLSATQLGVLLSSFFWTYSFFLQLSETGRFFWAFIITAVIALLGSLSWIFIVGALRQLDWATRPAYADSR